MSTEIEKVHVGEIVPTLADCEAAIDAAIESVVKARDSATRATTKYRDVQDQSERVTLGQVAIVDSGELWRQGDYRSVIVWYEQRFGVSRRRAQQVTAAARAIRPEIGPGANGNDTVRIHPTTEWQARELARVPEADRAEVLERAAAMPAEHKSPEGHTSAPKIKRAAEQVAAGEPVGPDSVLLDVFLLAGWNAYRGGFALVELQAALAERIGAGNG